MVIHFLMMHVFKDMTFIEQEAARSTLATRHQPRILCRALNREDQTGQESTFSPSRNHCKSCLCSFNAMRHHSLLVSTQATHATAGTGKKTCHDPARCRPTGAARSCLFMSTCLLFLSPPPPKPLPNKRSGKPAPPISSVDIVL